MTDKQTLDIYDARAADYAQMTAESLPDKQLQSFLDLLPECAQVLDLGCGPGRSAMMIARVGHKVTATDASAEMIRLASSHDGVTARQESFDGLAGRAIYDGVWANFSLLHAERDALPRHLQAISMALRPGGVFHIGMKTGAGTQRDGLGRRYTYVTDEELTALLQSVGLEPKQRWTGKDKGLDGEMAPWLVIQAVKHD